MAETILFAGNGINTINSNSTWEMLLRTLHKDYYDAAVSFTDIIQKPFPLVYEQIVLWQLKKHRNTGIERTLKKIIAAETCRILPNEIHTAIAAKKINHIITANYEFNLVKDPGASMLNRGCIKETTYSIFRHFRNNGKTYWHLHGDAQHVTSINLGYEHYCGQLQKMREYVTGTYIAADKNFTKLFTRPLVNRAYLKSAEVYSWVDFFFRDNTTIKIFGFRMELEELDIWWLLTYRAKILYGAKKGHQQPRNNRVLYFIPRQFTKDRKGVMLPAYKTKKALMEGMNINVVELDLPHGAAFYQEVLRFR
jgi:hypothetical protein